MSSSRCSRPLLNPLVTALVVACPLLAGPGVAGAQEDPGPDRLTLKELLERLTAARDAELSVGERESALKEFLRGLPEVENRRALARFRSDYVLLLRGLAERRTEAELTRLNALAISAAAEIRPPLPGLAQLLAPFLDRDVPPELRVVTLRGCALARPDGIAETLRRLVDEVGADPQAKPHPLERMLVGTASRLEPERAAPLLCRLVDVVRGPGSLQIAVAGLRQPEYAGLEKVEETLLKLTGHPQEAVAGVAAQGLADHGSYAGVGLLIERLQAGRAGARSYRAICAAVDRPEGFAGLDPDDVVAWQRRRADAVAALAEWWEAEGKLGPAGALLRELKEAGVSVPAAADGKAAIGAFVAGLGLESRRLRNACHEQLELRLGGRDAELSAFRSLPIGNDSFGGALPEPPDGFADPERRRALFAHQQRQAEEWRRWWEANQAKLKRVKGRWVVPAQRPQR